jgi:hypothetical protein
LLVVGSERSHEAVRQIGAPGGRHVVHPGIDHCGGEAVLECERSG